MAEEKDVKKEAEEETSQSQETPVENAEQEQQESTQEETNVVPVPQEGESEVDEAGVPWKNRAMEWKRKYGELVDGMPELARSAGQAAAQETLSQSGGKQEYTLEELESFASQTDDPTHKAWAQKEIRKREKEDLRDTIRNEIQSANKQRTNEQKRQEAVGYVTKAYPDLFRKDTQGNLTEWDNSHPQVKAISQLMKDERFKEDPEGLMAAADIAYARHMKSQAPKQQKKVKDLEAEKKSAQKQTMSEGGGVKETEGETSVQTALKKAKESGRKQDATEAMKEIFKARGFLQE